MDKEKIIEHKSIIKEEIIKVLESKSVINNEIIDYRKLGKYSKYGKPIY